MIRGGKLVWVKFLQCPGCSQAAAAEGSVISYKTEEHPRDWEILL